MVDSIRIKEVHACLGAEEFSYYEDDNGDQQPYYMNIARTLTWFARAYGISFKPDGEILPIRQRVTKSYDANNKVTIPDGWTRGQFADNTEQDNPDGQKPTDIQGNEDEERMGIAYQQVCNKYENFDDDDPLNNTYKRGDVVLCENMLQYIESYLEDLDKGLNWQEMGTGLLPSADGGSVCTFEGIGTLLAEVAYMLSQLSSNIYQTHNLALQSVATNYEILKGLGLPLDLGSLEVSTGESDKLGLGDDIKAYIPIPKIADDSTNIHKRLMDIIVNLSLIIGQQLDAKEETQTP